MTTEPTDLDTKRRERDRRRIADAVLEDLGHSAEGLANLVDGAPEQIREALLQALERQEGYRGIGRQHASADEAEGIPGDRCRNMVCPDYIQFDGFDEQPDGRLIPIGIPNRCKHGAEHAQGCLFRMVESPPCDPFRRLPSHAEALRMLMRAGLLEPDEFGHWNDTDFAQREATSTLWWAYIKLLIDSGRVEGLDDNETQNMAMLTLGYPPHRPDTYWCVDIREPTESQHRGPFDDYDEAKAALDEARADGHTEAWITLCRPVGAEHLGLSVWGIAEDADEHLREGPPGEAWANWDGQLVKLRDPKVAKAELEAWAERNLVISCYLPVSGESTD